MLEVVVNISEGQDRATIDRIAAAAGGSLLDLHTDPDHHRSVLTLAGTTRVGDVATTTVARLDLLGHRGVHPRMGVLDVVPFVPLGSATMEEAVAARDRFARWCAEELHLPCFLYGPERSLPEVRRGAFTLLAPDFGPAAADPRTGACAVGARPALVAYNLWMDSVDLAQARQIARRLRGPAVRALGLDLGGRIQVSMNLIDPWTVGPAEVYDQVSALATVQRAELVGLIPASVLNKINPARWAVLGLDANHTIEARLQANGLIPPR